MANFTDKNISSITGQTNPNNRADKLLATKTTLVGFNGDIDDFLAATGFSEINLSSMLHGAGQHLATGINALLKNKEALQEIINSGLFDAKSISSMLDGAGKNLATGINALLENKEALQEIINSGLFDAKSISSMLHGAGQHLATGINAIYSKQLELKTLCNQFKPTEIATRLNSVPPNKLAQVIDEMLANNTEIKAGSNTKIADTSLAAQQKTGVTL
jgi:hypothetical protein